MKKYNKVAKPTLIFDIYEVVAIAFVSVAACLLVILLWGPPFKNKEHKCDKCTCHEISWIREYPNSTMYIYDNDTKKLLATMEGTFK